MKPDKTITFDDISEQFRKVIEVTLEKIGVDPEAVHHLEESRSRFHRYKVVMKSGEVRWL